MSGKFVWKSWQVSSGIKWKENLGPNKGYVVSECKEDDFEGIGVAIFGFMEEISNVSWP